jgi:hypothetical protein
MLGGQAEMIWHIGGYTCAEITKDDLCAPTKVKHGIRTSVVPFKPGESRVFFAISIT